MRVLQLIGSPLQSGAGRAVYTLHRAFKSHGIDSRLLGRIEAEYSCEPDIYAIPLWNKIPVSMLNRLYFWRLKRRFGKRPHMFHPISHGLDLQKMALFQDADIIHIQWANASTFSPAFWRALRKENRPIVLTLRDMWPFTGGCHFSGDCDRFRTGCGNCPLLTTRTNEDITLNDVEFKSEYFRSIHFIAISEHFANIARRSQVLSGCNIRVIPNSVALDKFTPIEKQTARRLIGLPEDKVIIAAGAVNLADPRKGSETLVKVFKTYGIDSNVWFAVFGKRFENIEGNSPKNCSSFGEVKNQGLLNQIYAAADIFLMPSLQESFGKVTVEACASGTPVIAYDNTPAENILLHNKTGWLVRHGDVEGFVKAVECASMIDSHRLVEMGRRASHDVRRRFSLAVVVEQYHALYKELLLNREIILPDLSPD